MNLWVFTYGLFSVIFSEVTFLLMKARLEWMLSLGRELGGSQKASDMAAGKGVSLILKDVGLKYIKPVLYPDTVR